MCSARRTIIAWAEGSFMPLPRRVLQPRYDELHGTRPGSCLSQSARRSASFPGKGVAQSAAVAPTRQLVLGPQPSYGIGDTINMRTRTTDSFQRTDAVGCTRLLTNGLASANESNARRHSAQEVGCLCSLRLPTAFALSRFPCASMVTLQHTLAHILLPSLLCFVETGGIRCRVVQ